MWDKEVSFFFGIDTKISFNYILNNTNSWYLSTAKAKNIADGRLYSRLEYYNE